MSSFHTAGPWPDHDDAREYLKNAGVVMSNFEIVGTIRAIKGTIAEFERRVNWSPFLAAGDNARVFDPPTEGRFLSLEGGLVSLTSLSTGVGAYGTGGPYRRRERTSASCR